MFRLHIDIPLDVSEEASCVIAQEIIARISSGALSGCGAQSLKYRMGNDGDRTTKNYLVKTDSGHATGSKVEISL